MGLALGHMWGAILAVEVDVNAEADFRPAATLADGQPEHPKNVPKTAGLNLATDARRDSQAAIGGPRQGHHVADAGLPNNHGHRINAPSPTASTCVMVDHVSFLQQWIFSIRAKERGGGMTPRPGAWLTRPPLQLAIRTTPRRSQPRGCAQAGCRADNTRVLSSSAATRTAASRFPGSQHLRSVPRGAGWCATRPMRNKTASAARQRATCLDSCW